MGDSNPLRIEGFWDRFPIRTTADYDPKDFVVSHTVVNRMMREAAAPLVDKVKAVLPPDIRDAIKVSVRTGTLTVRWPDSAGHPVQKVLAIIDYSVPDGVFRRFDKLVLGWYDYINRIGPVHGTLANGKKWVGRSELEAVAGVDLSTSEDFLGDVVRIVDVMVSDEDSVASCKDWPEHHARASTGLDTGDIEYFHQDIAHNPHHGCGTSGL